MGESHYRIKELREAHGWSQQQLADRAGTSQQQIWKWEGGHAEPAASAMIRLADAFDVTMDYLCGRTDGDDEAAKWDKLEVVHTFERLPRDGQILLANIAETIEDTYYSLPSAGSGREIDEGPQGYHDRFGRSSAIHGSSDE